MAAAMGESTSREPHRLRRRQRPRGGVRRDLPAAHIESFNYAISEGVYRALQVPGGGRGAASGDRAPEPALTRGRPSLAGHSAGGAGAEGRPRGAHRGGDRHLAARGAQGDAVPGGEGVPGRVPRAAQHLPRAAHGELLRSRVCCLTSAAASSAFRVSPAWEVFLRAVSCLGCSAGRADSVSSVLISIPPPRDIVVFLLFSGGC